LPFFQSFRSGVAITIACTALYVGLAALAPVSVVAQAHFLRGDTDGNDALELGDPVRDPPGSLRGDRLRRGQWRAGILSCDPLHGREVVL
jgi:hypothetical protein